MMLKEERFDYILKKLDQREMITYELLAHDLKVSEDTVRRDIEVLNRRGLLSKVRGGAISRAKNPLNFQDRAQYLNDGKRIIALKVQPFIKDGQTLFMDAGTTMCAIAQHFPSDINLRIITANQALIPILARFEGIEIIVLGGRYNRVTAANIGTKTCREVNTYIADLYLMGLCAIDSKQGITAAIQEDAAVKQTMLKASSKTIALGNSEKLEQADCFRVCSLEDLAMLITDLPSDDEKLAPFRTSGIQLV